MESAAGALDWLHCFIEELRICLPGCGAANLPALRRIGVTSIP
jgi:isopentenyl-diphosphate delta-isomerase